MSGATSADRRRDACWIVLSDCMTTSVSRLAVSRRHGLACEQHAVASAVPAEPGTCSGSSRCALDRSALGASPLIMVALALHVWRESEGHLFSEVI